MKDLIIYRNVITGKFVYGYKIEVKAEDYPLKQIMEILILILLLIMLIKIYLMN